MRILYFYPENPLAQNQGNNVRALALLHYFKSRNIGVDLVGVESEVFSDQDLTELKKQNLISNGYLLKAFDRRKHKLKYLINYSLPYKFDITKKFFSSLRLGQKRDFETILQKNKYDKIIISYAYWAPIISNSPLLKGAETIVDTHDFLTAQYKNAKKFSLGSFFEKEINILKKFDKILVISSDEKYLFSQFIDKEVVVATHPVANKLSQVLVSKKYDVIYVASENDHNINASKWFFDSVYNKLDGAVSICVIGKITKHIADYPNVTKVPFAESLDEYYAQSKIAICPMLSGTGLKIKVVEAMSFGLPIVCNERGVDGLLSKINNGCLVTNDGQEFADYISKLLQDDVFYAKIHQQSEQYFDENFELSSVYQKFDTIFLD